jgi:lipase maturation factor 1
MIGQNPPRVPPSLLRAARGLWPGESGPTVALVFQRVLALIFVVAWISLGVQIRVLIGERGLLPLAPLLRAGSLPLLGYPSLLRWPALATDSVLVGGTALGACLAALAAIGFRPRVLLGVSTALYLSFTLACRTFLSFQWDNLLLECGFLAIFLPTDRPAPIAHLLFRIVAFKLYFESGIAKWQSPLHDWQDGSAMTYYYETAPLPTALAFYAHHLPVWWHHLESRATLVLELVLPFAFFAPRIPRLVAAGALTGFQIINVATANYGFFCHLAVALHLFLLEDRDLARVARLVPRKPPPATSKIPRWQAIAGFTGLGVFALLSVLSALVSFAEPGPWLVTLEPVRRVYEPLRLVNTYHLFASITRDRIEPEFQVEHDGQWQPLNFWHKPGDPARRPDFVAPHQPRVDFQLWFYGLSYQSRPPLYVSLLLQRLCHDRTAVQPLFRERLPQNPSAVRIQYWRYHFAERRSTGVWWSRTLEDATPSIPCDR